MAVYLLHFTAPISPRHTCQHYIGWAESWPERIAIQRAGSGDAARLCQVAKERGIDFIVARIWEDGDRTLERTLKNRHNARRLCPVCRGEMEMLPDVNFYHAVGAKRHLAQEFAQKSHSVQTVCAG
jgi:putative endonuclease